MIRPPIVIVAGPTASGKTALAIRLARALDAEIVSADSQQCYRGLDAGTAKPDALEQAAAAHHLLDIAWPEEQLDVGRFVAAADVAIQNIHQKGKRVIVAGGTGLWIRALVRGLVDAPGRDEVFREAFRARLEREGLPALRAELERLDPRAAARILPGDRVRIERALEVHAQGGQTLSSLQAAHAFAERRYRARVLLLDPPRETLWARIEARTRALFIKDQANNTDPEGSPQREANAGEPQGAFLEGEFGPIMAEARWLRARIVEIPAAQKGLRIMGYGEASDALDAILVAADAGAARASLQQAIEKVCARTRQYAKRQRTWFRKDAPRLDETGAPLAWPPKADEAVAFSSLCSTLREWYETAR